MFNKMIAEMRRESTDDHVMQHRGIATVHSDVRRWADALEASTEALDALLLAVYRVQSTRAGADADFGSVAETAWSDACDELDAAAERVRAIA